MINEMCHSHILFPVYQEPDAVLSLEFWNIEDN